MASMKSGAGRDSGRGSVSVRGPAASRAMASVAVVVQISTWTSMPAHVRTQDHDNAAAGRRTYQHATANPPGTMANRVRHEQAARGELPLNPRTPASGGEGGEWGGRGGR